MKFANIAKKYGSKLAIGSALTTLAIQAQAAIPTGIEAQFTEMSTDTGTIGGWVLGVVMALVFVGILIKASRKAG